MSQALISTTVEGRRRAERNARSLVMTCDIPVARGAARPPIRTASPAPVCRPTGRAPRRGGVLDSRPRLNPERALRGADATESGGSVEDRAARRDGGARSNIDVVVRRRRLAGALAVGAVLAGVVWLVTIVGSDYADAVTPGTPSVTQVVHVRSGESLSDIARRIAADLPVGGVVEQLRDLNSLQTSGLRVGQPLLAPAY